MSRIAIFFLLVITPMLAMLLALLGVETIPTNPLGWFLLLVGVGYAAGIIIAYFIRKERFWEARGAETTSHEEHGDKSFWLITVGMSAVFFLSPVEYLFFPVNLPQQTWLPILGMGLVGLGAAWLVWARRTLRTYYSGHISVQTGQILVQNGPYGFIRHPAYTGYLLMALGVSLGYASLVGLASVFVVLLPSIIYRIYVEEKMLAGHFGAAYHQYVRQTKRLIPGIW
jgi:protein-S-isoprenylcysteine O-methyltransferase Ste14